MELTNQDKIRELGEKETKNRRWKKTFRMSISGERASYTRQNNVAETLSRE